MSVYGSDEIGASYLVKTFLAYEKPGYFLLLAAICCVLCIVFGRRKGRAVFFYPLLLLFAIFLNPYIFPYLFRGENELMTRYFRMLWLLPASLLVAFAVMTVVGVAKTKGTKLIFTVVFFAAAFLMGTPLVSSPAEAQAYVKGTYAYSFGEDRDLAALVSSIEKDSAKGEPAILFENDDLLLSVRERCAAFKPLLYKKGNETKGDYAVVSKDSDLLKTLTRKGRREMGTYGDYVLVK
ncbi:MAG: hypothetical protein VZR02_06625 [Lachnospiraceae bacterium]|nr:hypothetical protein [Lachnospiraceae bacterium]